MFQGTMTRKADAAHPLQHLLVKFGTDEDHIAIAGATDLPIGTCIDIPQAGNSVGVALLGSASETRTMVASAAIAAGAPVFAAADGKIAATGTVRVGTAMQSAAADGDEIQVDPCIAFTI